MNTLPSASPASSGSLSPAGARSPRRLGLADLRAVVLSAGNALFLERAAAASGGPPAFQARKLAEAREVLALSQIAPRLRVEYLDLTAALRVLVRLAVPVPCLPDPRTGALLQVREAVLGLTWPQEVLSRRLPGSAFVQILSPPGVWHPSVSSGPVQCLCLGVALPAGIKCRELLLMSFGALSMQSIQFDEFDPAGVMNREAARWWIARTHLVPLSAVPFLGTADLESAAGGGAA